jgi:AcrR family transcriptional regulator
VTVAVAVLVAVVVRDMDEKPCSNGEEHLFSFHPCGRQPRADRKDAWAMSTDPLREQLLLAARRVFARQGYEGTRIIDIVHEAGLSTGAVYGRFRSKNELLREAVVGAAGFDARLGDDVERVAELMVRGAAWTSAPLSIDDAVRLEAHVAARREPEVARAIDEAQARWHESVEPLLQRALADGSVAGDVDPEAVLFFVRTIRLGLLLQRAAGAKGPDEAGWAELMNRVVASLGRSDAATTATTSHDQESR